MSYILQCQEGKDSHLLPSLKNFWKFYLMGEYIFEI